MESIVLEPVQWASLPEIDDIVPLDNSDAALLDEVRDVLRRHGKLDRFGVCLLHKHFEVGDDEVAIEYTDLENRISQVVVERRDDKDKDAIQTMWRFQQSGVSMGTLCIARCGKSGMTHSRVHERQRV